MPAPWLRLPGETGGPRDAQAGGRRAGPPASRRVVYLNMDGANLSCGDDDAPNDVSGLACAGLGSIPPFSPAGYDCGDLAGCKQAVLDGMNQLWTWDPEAREPLFDLAFTTEQPAAGPYEMVVIGGSIGGGALGVAPLDCGDQNRNTVSFAFSDDVAWVGCFGALITTISQELAHALGLCHNDVPRSLMYPSVTDVTDCRQDWSCGNQIDDCYCEVFGYDPYCPRSYLEELLGRAAPDTTGPVVEILTPQSDERIPRTFTLKARARDDRGVAGVELHADGAFVLARGRPPEGGVYEFPAREYPEGEHEFCVRGLDDAGNTGQDCVTVEVGEGTACVAERCCSGAHCCQEDPDFTARGRTGASCDSADDCCGLCVQHPGRDAQCTEPCRPAGTCASDQCPPGWACEPADGEGERRHVCWPYAERRGPGWPCNADADCEAGACVPLGERRTCAPACDPDAADGGAAPAAAGCPDTFACVETETHGARCVYRCRAGGLYGAPNLDVTGSCAVAPQDRRGAAAASGPLWILLACAPRAARAISRRRRS